MWSSLTTPFGRLFSLTEHLLESSLQALKDLIVYQHAVT
jgi:hypothetical protein